jgi:DNA/RNA endonuclease YhcR with UshA esterase domain
MLQKEEKITVILMVMALLVLIIAYFGVIVDSMETSQYSEQSATGDRVVLHGDVVGKKGTFTGDHLILTVDSEGSRVKVFIHCDNGAEKVNNIIDIADTVEVTGTLEEYQGKKEIVVEQPGDVKLLG